MAGVAMAAGFAMAGPAAAQAQGCTVPADLVELDAPLPKLSADVVAGKPIRIVALGSSSTFGTGASSRERTYPARLEQELKAAWPGNSVRVINAGIGGQLARQMLARIDKDVVAHDPQLVVWQTGVNDAVRGVPIERFKQELRVGIARIWASGADVVLIDQQFYPRFAKVKNGPDYLAAVREIADEFDVPLVQRFRIMQHLIQSAQFTAESLLAPDKFHLNDLSYGCMSRLLAQSLLSVATPPPLPPAEKTPAKSETRM